MSENKLDVRKAFEAIAHIIGKRENVVIEVVDIKRKEPEENSA